MTECPVCATPLRLFTPHEQTAHVNACLDGASTEVHPDNSAPTPAASPTTCGVCGIWLDRMTLADRARHANACLDKGAPGASSSSSLRRGRSGGRVTRGCPALAVWLASLGLGRYERVFVQQDIDFETLGLLDAADVRTLSVAEGARDRIVREMPWARAWVYGRGAGSETGRGGCHTAGLAVRFGASALRKEGAERGCGTKLWLEASRAPHALSGNKENNFSQPSVSYPSALLGDLKTLEKLIEEAEKV